MNENASNFAESDDDVTLYEMISESYNFYTNKKINNYLQITVYDPHAQETLEDLEIIWEMNKELMIFIGDVKRLHLCLYQYDASMHKINLRDSKITDFLYSQQRWAALREYLWVDEHGKIER